MTEMPDYVRDSLRADKTAAKQSLRECAKQLEDAVGEWLDAKSYQSLNELLVEYQKTEKLLTRWYYLRKRVDSLEYQLGGERCLKRQ